MHVNRGMIPTHSGCGLLDQQSCTGCSQVSWCDERQAGAVQGLGLEVLAQVLDSARPSHVLQLQTVNPNNNLPPEAWWQTAQHANHVHPLVYHLPSAALCQQGLTIASPGLPLPANNISVGRILGWHLSGVAQHGIQRCHALSTEDCPSVDTAVCLAGQCCKSYS